jgi:hypothetical protein
MKVGVLVRVLVYILAPGSVQMNMPPGLKVRQRGFCSLRASTVGAHVR